MTSETCVQAELLDGIDRIGGGFNEAAISLQDGGGEHNDSPQVSYDPLIHISASAVLASSYLQC